MTTRRLACAILAGLLACAFSSATHAQGSFQTLGGSCSTGNLFTMSSGTAYSGAQDFMFCNGSTWGSVANFQSSGKVGLGMITTTGNPALTITSTGSVGLGTTTPKASLDMSAMTDGALLQTTSAAAGASCTSTLKGAIRHNSSTAVNNIEFCDGTNWRFMAASTTACGAPSGLSFTNVTGASLGTSYTSNSATITFSGCTSGGLSVSVSGAATAQISINGGAWTTSGSISSGQTIQARLTSSGSVSTTLTATVTVGSSSTNWTVTTRSAALKIFVTAAGYNSTLGGLSGADTLCQNEAGTAGYAGTYKAVLSDNTTSAASRLTLSYPIVNAYDSTVVSASNLWVGSISSAPTTPSGTSATNYFEWSGSDSSGALTGNSCSNWSSTTAGGVNFGQPSVGLGASWINNGTALNCNSTGVHLYCIQQ